MEHETYEAYCRNCGYLSAINVTYAETCDKCHKPVEWHSMNDKSLIEQLKKENEELKAKTDISIDLSMFRERRQNLRLSMQDVTNGTGVSKATISRIENGKECYYSTVVILNTYYKLKEKK
jgi:DNA-binding XRE family transcriptional regulator